MNRSSILCLVFILTLIFTISCSGGGGNVIAPGPGDRDVVSDAQNNGTLCTGLWQVAADKATGNVEVVQLRSADKILNVIGFMEPPALTNMDLDWDDLDIDFVNNTIDVGVILKHPIPDDVFTGFDVRGVCFGPEVTNADGLTILTGPEYFSGEPFGYLDGLLGAPDSFGHYIGLAGYKYYCADIGEDDMLSDFFADPANYANRGKFPAGGVIQRNFNLAWEGTGYDILVFNYAIYANYDWPIGEAPWDVDDWAITAANTAEAFCFTATETANTLWFFEGSGGGEISLDIEIWDWQGDISGVTIESVQSGVIAQTSYDTATPNVGAFTTYMYDFLNVVGVPTSAGDLDILITVTDAKTFGECWFLDMLSTGNAMYDEKIFNCFIYTVNVSDEPQAGDGLTIKATGPLPATVPVTNEKNFCVTANDTFSNQGIYYFTGDVGYDISYYDMTYTTSTLLGSIQDPFFGNIGGLLINVADLGSIEVPPMGATVFCNRNTSPMSWGGYNANGPVWWSSATDFPNLTNGYIYFNMAFVDLEYVYDLAGRMWGFWRNYSAGVDGATFTLDPGYGSSNYGSITGYFPVDHSSSGVDGQISEQHVKRFGIDNDVNPELLTAPCNMMWYYIENDPGNPSVECAGNASTFAFFTAKYTIDDEELEGLPIDVSCLHNWGDPDFEDAIFNWACVLEDYEDGTWCVSAWEWDGTAMQLIDRTDPIDGTPHNLDCDTENQEIHAWATDAGTTSYWIFEWDG